MLPLKIGLAATCTELVLKIMDVGYYVHIFMKNIKSLKPFNFYNSNQLMQAATQFTASQSPHYCAVYSLL